MPAPASAASLRKRVRFERAADVPDDMGGNDRQWSSLIELWGGLQPADGRELIFADALTAAGTAILTIRSSAAARTITEADRVRVGDGAPMQIRSITNPDQRNRFLQMIVERGVAT